MKGIILRVLVCLLALAVLPSMPRAEAGSKKKVVKSRKDADKAFDLQEVMSAPKQYMERDVFFYCRFASTGNIFKTINTRFKANEHANFAVWPDGAVLWEKEGRKNALPTLYISKLDAASLDTLRQLEKYELIAVSGRVVHDYANYPWIFVTGIERVQQPQDALCEAVVQHMQNGAEALATGNGGAAARHLEQALTLGLPPEYCQKAHEQLARAYLLDNQLDKAQNYLRMAVDMNPKDPILNLALADVCLKMGEPEEAIAHCQFAMEMSGKHPQVYGILAEAKSLMGDFVGAFNDLNVAGATPGITPREGAMLTVRRARIYVRADRLADAARSYAAVSEPGAVLANDGWLQREVGLFYETMYLNTGDPRYLDSAYESYALAAKYDRLNPETLYDQAETEFRRVKHARTGDYSGVKSLLEQIYQIAPEYTPARILEGRVLFAEGKAAEADSLYQAYVGRIGNDATALLALAEAYADQGNVEEAASLTGRAAGIQPWNARVKAVGKYLSAAKSSPSAASPVCSTDPAPANWNVGQAAYAAPQPVDVWSGDPNVYSAPQPATAWNGAPVMQPAPAPQTSAPWYNEQPATAWNGAPIVQPVPASQPAQTYPSSQVQTSARVVTVNPGDIIRVEQGTEYMIPSGSSFSPDINTSVPPMEPQGGMTPPSYPRTSVILESYPPVSLGHEGVGVSSANAYASLRAAEQDEVMASEQFLTPPAFTFSPDDSPVIVGGRAVPDEPVASMPVRNVNVYKKVSQNRRPAEITDSGSFELPPPVSAMVPNEDGKVYRTEVRLPTSASGIVMAPSEVPFR